VANALELMHRLAGSAQAQSCVATRLLAYAYGRDVAANQCDKQRIDAQIRAGGGRLLDVVAAIAEAPSFRTRQGGQ
jgi:hypothetical protein